MAFPVPGIYSTSLKGTCLVYVKPNGGADHDHIFDPRMAKDKKKNIPGLAYQLGNKRLSTEEIYSSSSSQQTTLIDQDYDSDASFHSAQENVLRFAPLRIPARASNNKLHTKHSLMSQKAKLTKLDCTGYRALGNTLKVVFSPITKRWMFADELKHRTAMHFEHHCSKFDKLQSKNKFFLLDDGESWVKVSDIMGAFKRKNVELKDAKLYRVDGSGRMVYQGRKETEESKDRLKKMEPTITAGILEKEGIEREQLYVCVARYLGFKETIPVEGSWELRMMARRPRKVCTEEEEMEELSPDEQMRVLGELKVELEMNRRDTI